MTTAQLQLYFRAWKAAAKAHGWDTVWGVSAAVAAHDAGHVWVSPALNKTLDQIYSLAAYPARQDSRSVTANDLRHACACAAVGHFVSSKRFTNAEFDKVLALLRLLANPDDLQNVMHAENAGVEGERRRHFHVITRADAPYWQGIARDRFGHCDLERLTIQQLQQLSLTIRNRQLRPAAEPVPA